MVGLLFAFIPVLGRAAASENGLDARELLSVLLLVGAKLGVVAAVAAAIARTALPPLARALARLFSDESFLMASMAFCLLASLLTARQGVSSELGAFVAGVMLSATDQQEAVLHHLGERRGGGRGCPFRAVLCGGVWGGGAIGARAAPRPLAPCHSPSPPSPPPGAQRHLASTTPPLPPPLCLQSPWHPSFWRSLSHLQASSSPPLFC